MASLVNAALVLLTLLFLAGLFENLQGATLGAIVIDAMLGLVHLRDMRRYYAVNRSDWVFFMGAMIGMPLTVGIIVGILIGVVLSLLLLIARSSQTSVRPLGRERVSGDYTTRSVTRGSRTSPGWWWSASIRPLFFADADRFRTRVQELTDREPDLTGVVLDAEAIYLTDTDGADMVLQVAAELQPWCPAGVRAGAPTGRRPLGACRHHRPPVDRRLRLGRRRGQGPHRSRDGSARTAGARRRRGPAGLLARHRDAVALLGGDQVVGSWRRRRGRSGPTHPAGEDTVLGP